MLRPTETEPLFQFVREPETRRPIGVVAGCFTPGGSPMVGYSLCNPKDRWNRALGRRIAQGRLDLFGAFPGSRSQLCSNLNVHKAECVALIMKRRLVTIAESMAASE